MAGLPKDEPWTELIGLEITSPILDEALKHNNLSISDAKILSYPNNTVLYNFYSDGISFAFIKDKLDSIDFFQDDKSFRCVSSEIILPFGIALDWTGERFVSTFGEPADKNGGMNSRMDIWFRYDHLQVEINEKNWDSAGQAIWKSITIF